jgi:hypothetical protein
MMFISDCIFTFNQLSLLAIKKVSRNCAFSPNRNKKLIHHHSLASHSQIHVLLCLNPRTHIKVRSLLKASKKHDPPKRCDLKITFDDDRSEQTLRAQTNTAGLFSLVDSRFSMTFAGTFALRFGLEQLTEIILRRMS